MKDMLANQESLTLEELKTYAQADSVKDFYYTGTTTVNTDDNWEAVDTTGITEETEEETEDDKSGFSSMGGGRGGQMSGQKPGRMGMQGDATIVGYSSDSAMTGFVAGTSTITDGQMFEENTQAYDLLRR